MNPRHKPPRLRKGRSEPSVGDMGTPEGGATIPLKQGHNYWRLLRTDRDGASRNEVIETTGPAVSKMLRPIGVQEGPWEIFRTGQDPPEWRIGDARPVQLRQLVRATGAPEKGPAIPGRVLATRMRYPGDTLPTVKGQKPWWVVVDIWWRRPDVTVYWPGFRVNWMGTRIRTVIDADWVLDEASWVPESEETDEDPGDETSLEAHGERISAAAGKALKIALPPIAAIGVATVAGYFIVKSGALKKVFGGKAG